MGAPVGAHRQHRLVGQQLERALVGEPAAEAARPARVGDERVAVHPQRQVALDELDRLVREVRERVRDALEAVALRPRSPAADEHLRQDERLAVLVAADRDQRRPALAGAITLSGTACASAPMTAS